MNKLKEKLSDRLKEANKIAHDNHYTMIEPIILDLGSILQVVTEFYDQFITENYIPKEEYEELQSLADDRLTQMAANEISIKILTEQLTTARNEERERAIKDCMKLLTAHVKMENIEMVSINLDQLEKQLKGGEK